jgi:hypothetical protein
MLYTFWYKLDMLDRDYYEPPVKVLSGRAVKLESKLARLEKDLLRIARQGSNYDSQPPEIKREVDEFNASSGELCVRMQDFIRDVRVLCTDYTNLKAEIGDDRLRYY